MGANCGCDDNCRDLSLLRGSKGDPGRDGEDGTFGANSSQWQFNVATVGNPGNGFLLFNNANLSAATSISVANEDGFGVTVTPWLAALLTSDTTLKAFIRVNKEFDSSSFVIYSVSAGVSNAGYYTYTIAYLTGSSNSPFALNDNVIFSYVISGNNGTAGASGSTILFNNLTDDNSGPTAGVNLAFRTDTIPANTLVANEDYVLVQTYNICQDDKILSDGNLESDFVEILNNGVSLPIFNSGVFPHFGAAREYTFTINRVSSTAARIEYTVHDNVYLTHIGVADMAGLDFTLPITINVYANNVIASAPTGATYIINQRLFAEYHAA